VEKAIIFFKSISKLALTPDINIVINANVNNTTLTPTKFLNRINKYTPAVTKVEECTKEDTGVGAAIAAGSQAEKGI
jgi:hypothetical protein